MSFIIIELIRQGCRPNFGYKRIVEVNRYMIVSSEFIPGKGMRNPHIQSLLPMLVGARAKIVTRRERLDLPDGDFLDLEWVGSGDGPIVALFHGMAGSLESPYIRRMMQMILELKWRGVLMYYRGCSGTPNRLEKTYHLAQTEDVAFLSTTLHARFPTVPLFAIGYSMGGNLLLKWLGDNPNQSIYCAAIAVSPPFDLRAASHSVRKGSGQLYQWLLMRDLRRYISKKYEYINGPISLDKLDTIKSFWDLDEKITAPVNGFKNAVEYYRQASCNRVLKNITTPTLIIHSKDDPLVPTETIPSEDWLSEHISLEISDYGGHLGFVSGSLQHPEFWLEQRILKFLEVMMPSVQSAAQETS